MPHDSACLPAEDYEGGNPPPVGWLGVIKPLAGPAYHSEIWGGGNNRAVIRT